MLNSNYADRTANINEYVKILARKAELENDPGIKVFIYIKTKLGWQEVGMGDCMGCRRDMVNEEQSPLISDAFRELGVDLKELVDVVVQSECFGANIPLSINSDGNLHIELCINLRDLCNFAAKLLA